MLLRADLPKDLRSVAERLCAEPPIPGTRRLLSKLCRSQRCQQILSKLVVEQERRMS